MKEFHRFLQPGMGIQACSIFPATFCWPVLKAHGQRWGFGLTESTLHTLTQSLHFQRRRVFADYRLWQSVSVGLGISKASRKPLAMKPHCLSQRRIPLGKSSPLPLVSNLLCFLFPELAFWSFWIWTKPKSQLKSHSTLAASTVLLVCTR